MVQQAFIDFFVAIVGVTGALIGLLFVAVSVAPRRLRDPATAHLAQTQASTALLLFIDTLIIGLLALFPDAGIGTGTLVVALLGLVYSFAVGRVALKRLSIDKPSSIKLGRIAIGILTITGFEIWGGLETLIYPHSTTGLYTVMSTMIGAVVFGISRAWELVGLQGTSLVHSLVVLHNPSSADFIATPEPVEEPGGGER